MPLIPVPVEVEIEVGGLVEAVDRIIARGAERKEKAWAELDAELVAIEAIARGMSSLYRRLLEEIQWSVPSEDPKKAQEERERQVREIHNFLHNDDLFSRLARLHGRIQAASQEHKLLPHNRKIVTDLRGLERSLDAYRNYWGMLQAGERQFDSGEAPLWNLADVLRCIEEDYCELSLRDLCEEAIRNRRPDLLYAIDGMVGRARHHIGFRHA